jgi:acetolactate synthase-1/3 small subunit
MAAMNDPLAAPAAGATPSRPVPGSGHVNRHVVVVIVNDRPGVLNRVSSLVRARNFNIESLVVGHTERPGISRMTITLRGDDFAVEQMGKQLYRLVDVLKVQDMPEEHLVEHELALVKVRATNHNRAEVLRIIELYKGRVIDVSPDSLIVEHSGTEQEIDSLVALLGGFGIRELVRTGTVAMARGSSVVDVEAILRAGTVPAVPEGVGARTAASSTATLTTEE